MAIFVKHDEPMTGLKINSCIHIFVAKTAYSSTLCFCFLFSLVQIQRIDTYIFIKAYAF